MKFEASSFELDPSYDPERPDSESIERQPERQSIAAQEQADPAPHSYAPVTYITIPNYHFPDDTNPYAFDSAQRQSLTSIAAMIDVAIQHHTPADTRVLVRGVQSAAHVPFTRQELIESILVNGSDHHDPSRVDDLHALPYTPGASESILGGFHVWKPRCEDRPQYIVDIWMLFNKSKYENIEYIHPRHQVAANDRWRPLDASDQGLVAMIIIN